MNENENVTVVENENIDYIEAINELKATTVSKDEYSKLQAENKKLLKSLMAGESLERELEPQKSVGELRHDFATAETTLDGITAALKLRTALLEKGEADPFLPSGRKIMPTDEDVTTANRVASALQDIVEYADGDPLIFSNELSRVLVDTAPVRRYR